MKIYLPSGYRSPLSDDIYYPPGTYEEGELPPKLVAYLLEEGFAEQVEDDE